MPKHEIMISADVPGVDEGLRSFLRKVIRAAWTRKGWTCLVRSMYW